MFKVGEYVKWKSDIFLTTYDSDGEKIKEPRRLMRITNRIKFYEQSLGVFYECCYADDSSAVVNNTGFSTKFMDYDLILVNVPELAKYRIRNED